MKTPPVFPPPSDADAIVAYQQPGKPEVLAFYRLPGGLLPLDKRNHPMNLCEVPEGWGLIQEVRLENGMVAK